jgi:hypothetical protein
MVGQFQKRSLIRCVAALPLKPLCRAVIASFFCSELVHVEITRRGLHNQPRSKLAVLSCRAVAFNSGFNRDGTWRVRDSS